MLNYNAQILVLLFFALTKSRQKRSARQRRPAESQIHQRLSVVVGPNLTAAAAMSNKPSGQNGPTTIDTNLQIAACKCLANFIRVITSGKNATNSRPWWYLIMGDDSSNTEWALKSQWETLADNILMLPKEDFLLLFKTCGLIIKRNTIL